MAVRDTNRAEENPVNNTVQNDEISIMQRQMQMIRQENIEAARQMAMFVEGVRQSMIPGSEVREIISRNMGPWDSSFEVTQIWTYEIEDDE